MSLLHRTTVINAYHEALRNKQVKTNFKKMFCFWNDHIVYWLDIIFWMLKRNQYHEIWKNYKNIFWRCTYMLSKNVAHMISHICIVNQKVGTGMWKPVQEVQLYLGEPNNERDLFLVVEQESTCAISQCPVHVMCMFNAI